MSVPYKNPISSVQVSTPQSVSRTSVFGTTFSTLNVGGYMEVYKLSDLSLTLTASTYPSLIQLSANTIPIRFTKGNNTFLSPDYLTLNSDNISSGRRRLGMMVYVHETDLVYQFLIPNYDTLWNNLSGLTGFSAVTYSDYTTVINNRSSAGQNFLNAWTASTIEGVSGYTSANANWRIFQLNPGGLFTGGTVTGPTIFLNGLSANTISATTYYNLPSITGLYLPLSGGTVFGNTFFSSGLTANTLNVTGLTKTSGITSTAAITFPQKTISSTYTATTSDYLIDVTGGTFNVQLPSAIGIQGRLLVIKNNGGGATTVFPISGQTIDDKPLLILSETNSVQLSSNGDNWVILGQDRSTVNNSTGVFQFSGMSIASPTTFNVSQVKGWIVDDTTNPLSPQIYYVNYSGGVHTAIYVTASTETFIYLTSGGTISQSNITLTEQQRRQNIFLGKLGHANKTNIINVFNQPDFVLSPISQLRDMIAPIGYINGGVYPYANASNLTFATTAGYLYGLGINFISSSLNPSSIYVSGNTTTTFQYRTQTGGTASNTTLVDPLNYDVGGVITPLTGTKATNQRVYLVANGQIRLQYGQTSYTTLSSAIAGINSETFNVFSNFRDNGILIGILSILSTCTDLTDTSKAQFFLVSKFGETVGAAGGVATTNLQQAYNNSTNPEIIINSTLDGLSIQNGTGNADNITPLLQGNNTVGVTTSFIRADGLFSGSSISTPGFTANTNGLSATTISATTYLNLPLPVITGTTNYIPKFTSGTTLTNSLIFDSFTGTGINTSSPIAMLDVKLSATTDYILNLKDTNNDEFFRINKVGGVLINSGATFYGGANFQSTPGIYINGDGSAVYGSNVYNKNIITFMQPFTSNSISGLQAATLNYGNVRCGLYFQNNVSARPELFGSSVVEGATVETFRITEAGSFNIGGLNTDNSRFTIRNSKLGLGSKAFSILNSGSTENIYFNDNGNAYFNGNLTATTISGNSLTLSSSASTINLNNPNQQQIRFFSGGTGAPQLSTYSPGVKIILNDNIDSSISTGMAIGVDTGILWYGADWTGNGHEWYAGTRKLSSLIGSTGFQLFGLGGPTTVAFTISGTSSFGSKGGVGYMDFLRVVNNWSAATNTNKWFRTNITGGLEILNNAYTSVILSLTDNGILSVGGGNPATVSSNDGQTNYLTFNNNSSQIYDDGNFHIHSRAANQAMWINTNNGLIILGAQSPVSGGNIATGISIASSTQNGYVTINTGRTVTTAASYGYLTTGGAGTYPGGSQSVSISLYANNRIWGQEIDAFSDERMKNIEGDINLEDGLKLVNNLKPIKYRWKEGDDKGIKVGYSAQQVIKSGFDHLVSIIPNEGLEETIDEDGFMSPKDTQFSMNYDQVTPYHGVVIKHLLDEIEKLKEEIKKLNEKL